MKAYHSSSGTLTGVASNSGSNQLSGLLQAIGKISGNLSNTTIFVDRMEFRVNEGIIQYKYEDQEEWTDIINISAEFEEAAMDISRFLVVDELPQENDILPKMIYVIKEND